MGTALMLAGLGVAGGFLAAEELADEPVGRPRDAEREPLGPRQVEVRHLVRPLRDAAAALQSQVRAVVIPQEVAPRREHAPADRRVAERGDDRIRRAGEKRSGTRKLVDRPVPAAEDDPQSGLRRAHDARLLRPALPVERRGPAEEYVPDG